MRLTVGRRGGSLAGGPAPNVPSTPLTPQQQQISGGGGRLRLAPVFEQIAGSNYYSDESQISRWDADRVR